MLAREDRVTQLRPIYGAGACARAPAGVTTANLDAQTQRRYVIVRHAVRVATMPSPSEHCHTLDHAGQSGIRPGLHSQGVG